jgi:hypothetical protein
VIAGALLARGAGIAAQALAGGSGETAFYQAKLRTARFYTDQVLPTAQGLARIVEAGAASVSETDSAML